MLLTLNDHNTTCSLYLLYLFYALSMIMIFAYIFVQLCTTVICTEVTIMNMCPCLLMVALCMVCHWLCYSIIDMHLFKYRVIMDVFVSLFMSL